MTRLVIVESPYAGDVAANEAYARAAIRDCIMRGESPFASHLLYTQPGLLRDDLPEERVKGIDAGLAWYNVVSLCVVYVDRGISEGMRVGMAHARTKGVPVEERRLP